MSLNFQFYDIQTDNFISKHKCVKIKKKSLKGSISCIIHARLFIATYLFYPWWLSIKHILKQITINNLSKIHLKSMWFILSCYMVFTGILLPWTKNDVYNWRNAEVRQWLEMQQWWEIKTLTCIQELEYLTWWQHPDGHGHWSFLDPLRPAYKAVPPPRSGPERRIGWLGCGACVGAQEFHTLHWQPGPWHWVVRGTGLK